MPDGTVGTRSMKSDIETLSVRSLARVVQTIGVDLGKRILRPGVDAYDRADYEVALSHFTETVASCPQLSEDLRPHIRICERVLSVVQTDDDILYRVSVAAWKHSSWLMKLRRRAYALQVRCKYCGHYTPYVAPDHGFAYLGSNNCKRCKRGYPVPEFGWDSMDGQAYIYYRHSVTEDEFYAEFEQEYDVYPDHTHFMKKSE